MKKYKNRLLFFAIAGTKSIKPCHRHFEEAKATEKSVEFYYRMFV